jgi:Zn-dependent M28 family amino/carboxypeptidase
VPDPPADLVPISGTALLEHLNVLAADSLLGRRAGSQHELRSAEYIRDRFQEIGMEAGNAAAYFQNFQIPFPVDGQAGLTSNNVLAVLPGKGSLAHEWVVFGAHYDHMGFTQTTPQSVEVFNGADDNASGTALALEIARYLNDYFEGIAENPADRRSLMVQAYGAEEVGLIGSLHFCDSPTVPMDSVVAMVNLDMVGRLADDELGLIATSSSTEWFPLLEELDWQGLTLGTIDGFINRSDQYCFYLNQKPVLFLHTGLHPQYHTPFDDVELINVAGMVRIGHFAAEVLLELAYRPEPLPFTGGVLTAAAAPGAVPLSESLH